MKTAEDTPAIEIVGEHVKGDFTEIERIIFLETLGQRLQQREEEYSSDYVFRLRTLYIKQLNYFIPEPAFASFLRNLYYKTDTPTSCAVLQSLPHLQDPAAHLEYAHEALRSNVTDIFAALAFYNKYPYQYFSQELFNQMVLKSLFLSLPLDGIIGLKKRINPGLKNMVANYHEELILGNKLVPSGCFQIANLEVAAGNETA